MIETESLPSSAQQSTTFYGKVGMAICYDFDGNMESPQDDCCIASSLIKVLPYVTAGDLRRLTKWQLFCLWDALGSWPDRDEEMQALYHKVEAKMCPD